MDLQRGSNIVMYTSVSSTYSADTKYLMTHLKKKPSANIVYFMSPRTDDKLYSYLTRSKFCSLQC